MFFCSYRSIQATFNVKCSLKVHERSKLKLGSKIKSKFSSIFSTALSFAELHSVPNVICQQMKDLSSSSCSKLELNLSLSLFCFFCSCRRTRVTLNAKCNSTTHERPRLDSHVFFVVLPDASEIYMALRVA